MRELTFNRQIWGTAAHASVRACAMIGFLLFATLSHAHEISRSYLALSIDQGQIVGQLDMPMHELQGAVALDGDGDGTVTYDELAIRFDAVRKYVLDHLKIRGNQVSGVIRIIDDQPTVSDFTDGVYVTVNFLVEGVPRSKSIEVDYELFFELNPLHRGLFKLQALGKTQTAIFNPDQPIRQFETGLAMPWDQFREFLWEGVWHIWIGFDHILFLLALLLPAVFKYDQGKWKPADHFGRAFVNVLKIVTAFTAAHSITLTLATLEIVKLPSRWVEASIAASVIVAALNNIVPFARGNAWIVAFCFGLIHGFGFANVLSDLGLGQGLLVLTLIAFNVGVELGQLAIVGLFLPIAYALRRSQFYQRGLVRVGSWIIILIAGIWLLERVFQFKLLPF